MYALILNEQGAKVTEVPEPLPGPSEALVRVLLAGVCQTDIELARGYMGFSGIPGHEFVGVVESSPDPALAGKRVVGEINLYCGSCSFCRQGLTRHCPYRQVLGIQNRDGAFAEYLALPIHNLHMVPDNMDDETAVFVEPVAACFEILEQVDFAGKRIVVVGDGKLGILSARVLAGFAERVVLAGRHEEKLSLVTGENIETCFSSDLVEKTTDPEAKFDVAVEVTGRAEGFRTALDLVRPCGTIVQKSTVAGNIPVDLSRVVVDEITVVGSRCGPFPPALQALSAGRVKVKDLISGTYPLQEAASALSAAQQPDALKVLVRVSG
ncbi:MAG: alcohol dehydrogenase catalytic domain-containing protein [bacterium]